MADTRLKRFLLLAVSGVLTALTLVFPKLGFFEWLTLVPAGLFLLDECEHRRLSTRAMYGYGFFFFMCYGTVVFHWFVNLYPLDFVSGMTPAGALFVVLAGVFGLSVLQAIGGGFFFVLVRSALNTQLLKPRRALRPFLIATAWAIYEWTQTIGWWGVPWGRLSIGQSEYIVGLQTASLFGPYIITFALVLVNLCVAYAILERGAIKAMGIAVCATLVFQYGVGAALYFIPVDGEQTVKVAAVQGNISSNEKWTSESRSRTLEVYAEYTVKAAQNGAQIVVWPETALPYSVTPDNFFGEYLSMLARETGVTIFAGAFTDSDGPKQYNSIIAVLPDGSFHETVYKKQKLVPFGEFVPLSKVIETVAPPLAELVMVGSDLEFGERSEVIDLDGADVGCLVCFDSIYESLTREATFGGAQLITLSTNDSWFTDSAALYMHNAQAQLRAIENGRYIVRSANTGISTVISSKGEVLAELDPLVEGMVEYEVHLNNHTTLYTLIGNALVYLAIAFFAFVFGYDVVQIIRRRRSTNIGI